MKKGIITLGVGFSVVFAAACARSTPEPVTYTIEMSEYAYSPSTIEVRVGQPVTLEIVNTGGLEHEIMFGKDVMMRNDRPDGYMLEMFGTAGVEPVTHMSEDTHEGMHDESHTGFMLVLPENGDRGTITFTPTQEMVGEWEMGCFVQDGVHYEAGMRGMLVVKP